ncbi:carboxymuconolactone decarboxylase family protein [Nannocystis pusilla]|uniref:carboxymuconolactone decarboxylase family protein n=1 Tax=Nannocystis pusilla TaxID=889268 RepID=UPI003B7BAA31
MELTTFRRAKLLKQFELLDRDGDGHIDRSDFANVARRICGILDIDAESAAGRELLAAHTNVYEQVCGVDSSRVTFEQFVRDARSTLLSGEGGVRTVMGPLVRAVLQACDSDGDHELSSVEFRRLLLAGGCRRSTPWRLSPASISTRGPSFRSGSCSKRWRSSTSAMIPTRRAATCSGRSGDEADDGQDPYADPTGLPEHVLRSLAALPPLKIFHMMAHAHTAFPGIIQLAKAIYTELELPGDLRELAILHAAKILGGDYVWTHHVSAAQHEGVARDKIAAVRDGRLTAPCLTEVEQAMLAFVSDCMHSNRPNDITFERLAKLLPRGSSWSCSSRSARTPCSAGSFSPWTSTSIALQEIAWRRPSSLIPADPDSAPIRELSSSRR